MIEVITQGPFKGAMVEHHVKGQHSAPDYIIIDRTNRQGERFAPGAADTTAAFVPLCCWAPQDAELAHKLYAAYNLGGPIERAGLSWNGQPVPTWDELLEKVAGGDVGARGVVEKWRAVAEFMDTVDALPNRGVA